MAGDPREHRRRRRDTARRRRPGTPPPPAGALLEIAPCAGLHPEARAARGPPAQPFARARSSSIPLPSLPAPNYLSPGIVAPRDGALAVVSASRFEARTRPRG